ncbi:MAG: hypothetical protein Q8K59_08360 [Nitrosomonas sp.]|nr:hypothetical protein [Nitrosomonas sp.]MDP1951087.1 hypothetical protein [Nitrosomonas sp.]
MRLIYVTIMLLLLMPSLSQANDYWQEYRHKKMMSLCSINHLELRRLLLDRDNDGEQKMDLEFILENMTEAAKKREEIGQNIKHLYASRVMNTIGISTAKTVPDNSLSGTLDIHVVINDRGSKTPDGERIYNVTHLVQLYEKGLSRFGREDKLELNTWLAGSVTQSLVRADMEAISLVTKAVDEMKKTFQEAREYCAKHDLFQR